MPLLNDDGLYVAGLDVAVDALSPEDALEWLESEIYEMIYDFQNHADAALIFWMPDQGRWKEDLTTSTYHWCLVLVNTMPRCSRWGNASGTAHKKMCAGLNRPLAEKRTNGWVYTWSGSANRGNHDFSTWRTRQPF
ncbi:hypothetical protein O5290_26190 [Escherichia coli]|nr:hypothetical protein [Escherichia coli]